jgi:hypothetical protein
MKTKMVRAVVRGVDVAPRKSPWAPDGSPDLQQLLASILPPPGEDFVVVWESREVQEPELPKAAVA